MHRKSVFNIKIDFEKSYDSYIYDKNRQEYFLDFFGLEDSFCASSFISNFFTFICKLSIFDLVSNAEILSFLKGTPIRQVLLFVSNSS